MGEKKPSPTLDFTRQYLKQKPEASFAEIRDAAAAEDLKLYPIVYGRAKALEGLVKVAPYGSKKKEREAAARAKDAAPELAAAAAADQATAGAERGPARPSAQIDAIDAVIAGVRGNHQDRERYLAALIKISEILDRVL
jgi:hypothetical protein